MRDDPRPIGYYVHHQGRGHLARARAVRAELSRRCTLIGTFVGDDTSPSMLRLPDDRITGDFSGADGERSRPTAVHYAPVGAANVRARMAILAAWIAAERPACLVVDVSCEIALFARLLSVPVALVRLAGRRIDTPHLEAFRAADVLIAPFPAVLDDEEMPGWVRDKTSYAGFIGETLRRSGASCAPRRVALVLGRGGMPVSVASLGAAAEATTDWDWQVFGLLEATADLPGNLVLNSWCEDLSAHLADATLVVGGCGDGLLAQVAALGKPFVCLPEDRAFDEQRCKARYLAQHDMAVVHYGWPAPARWPALLEDACTLDPSRLTSLHNPSAAGTCAAIIEALIANRADQNGSSSGTR